MQAATGICGVLAATFALAATAADQPLGNFRDWSAMRFGGGAARACMAFSQPVKSEGDYSKRDQAFVFVTHRPGTRERDRISVETGYPFKPGSGVTLSVGEVSVTLATRASTAWLDDDDAARRLVQAMRRGRELEVRGTSSRGTDTVDQYSLYGFSAAHDAIDKACAK